MIHPFVPTELLAVVPRHVLFVHRMERRLGGSGPIRIGGADFAISEGKSGFSHFSPLLRPVVRRGPPSFQALSCCRVRAAEHFMGSEAIGTFFCFCGRAAPQAAIGLSRFLSHRTFSPVSASGRKKFHRTDFFFLGLVLWLSQHIELARCKAPPNRSFLASSPNCRENFDRTRTRPCRRRTDCLDGGRRAAGPFFFCFLFPHIAGGSFIFVVRIEAMW